MTEDAAAAAAGVVLSGAASSTGGALSMTEMDNNQILPLPPNLEDRAVIAMNYVREQGWSMTKAANVAGVSRNCLRGMLKRGYYRNPGRPTLLSEEDYVELRKIIDGKNLDLNSNQDNNQLRPIIASFIEKNINMKEQETCSYAADSYELAEKTFLNIKRRLQKLDVNQDVKVQMREIREQEKDEIEKQKQRQQELRDDADAEKERYIQQRLMEQLVATGNQLMARRTVLTREQLEEEYENPPIPEDLEEKVKVALSYVHERKWKQVKAADKAGLSRKVLQRAVKRGGFAPPGRPEILSEEDYTAIRIEISNRGLQLDNIKHNAELRQLISTYVCNKKFDNPYDAVDFELPRKTFFGIKNRLRLLDAGVDLHTQKEQRKRDREAAAAANASSRALMNAAMNQQQQQQPRRGKRQQQSQQQQFPMGQNIFFNAQMGMTGGNGNMHNGVPMMTGVASDGSSKRQRTTEQAYPARCSNPLCAAPCMNVLAVRWNYCSRCRLFLFCHKPMCTSMLQQHVEICGNNQMG